MNKIKVVNEKVDSNVKNIDIKFLEKESDFGINKLIIDINKNTKLSIDYFSDIDAKYEITINVKDKVKLDLNEIRLGTYNKVRYIIKLGDNSKVNIYKLYDTESIKEWVRVYLNRNSVINYYFKTVSKNSERYDLEIRHEKDNSVSNIVNNGINILNGSLIFNVSTLLPNNVINTTINQSNRIVNLNNKLCQINPNLFIDENDVVANHSAYIGRFKEEEIFYLQRLGLTYNDAEKLLIKGFLRKDMPSKMEKNINKITKKYWR